VAKRYGINGSLLLLAVMAASLSLAALGLGVINCSELAHHEQATL